MIWIFLFFFREPGTIFFILLFQDFFFKRRILRIYGSGSFGIFPRFLDRISPPPPLRRNIMTEFISSDQDRSGSFRIFFFCRTSYLAESSVFGVEGNSVLSGSFRIVRIVFRIFKRRISYSVESVVYFVWIQGGNFFRCCQDRSGSRRIARGSECAVKGGGSRICRQDFSWIPRRCRNRSTSIRIIQDR